MPDIWFSADWHFHHKMMAEKFRFNFNGDIDLMNTTLVSIINACVKSEDTLYFLGDLSFAGGAKTDDLMCQINCTDKYLIMGNHDSNQTKQFFLETRDMWYLRGNHPYPSIHMCHYPMLSWRNMHHGTWHLHGHSHGNLQYDGGMMLDVGIDNHPEFRPWHIDEVAEYMSQQIPQSVDHHEQKES